MEEKKLRKSNEDLLPEFLALQRSIDACIQTARAKQVHMHERFGTSELALTIAQLQVAQIYCSQVAFRLGYKGDKG